MYQTTGWSIFLINIQYATGPGLERIMDKCDVMQCLSQSKGLTCPAVAKNSPSRENFIKLMGEAVLQTKEE